MNLDGGKGGIIETKKVGPEFSWEVLLPTSQREDLRGKSGGSLPHQREP